MVSIKSVENKSVQMQSLGGQSACLFATEYKMCELLT